MTGEDFRGLVREALKRAEEHMQQRRRALLVFYIWLCAMGIIQICIWANKLDLSNWWTIPLGVTLGLLAVTAFVKFLISFDI